MKDQDIIKSQAYNVPRKRRTSNLEKSQGIKTYSAMNYIAADQ